MFFSFSPYLYLSIELNEESIYQTFIKEITMEKRLISAKDLLIRYGISKSTLRKWVRELELPLIVISDKKKYVYEIDLIEWEKDRGIRTINL